MNTQRVAMIHGHPAHELATAGMLQRWQPAVLFLTLADSAGESGRPELSRRSLAALGLTGEARFLDVSEVESYRRLRRHDHAWYDPVLAQIGDWLAELEPTAVFCDAFELYNPHHDVCSAMTAAACRRLGLRADVYHVPLACHGGAMSARSYSDLDAAGWDCRYLELRPDESERKLQAFTSATPREYNPAAFLRSVAPDRFIVEPYRPAPEPGAFGSPPPTFGWATWEERGRQRVREGKYREALSFEDHFLPLVRHLGLLDPPRDETPA